MRESSAGKVSVRALEKGVFLVAFGASQDYPVLAFTFHTDSGTA
jgi:hypothetical protein